jgi:ABC-type transport system involved in multi-copper enzyme maturation permease subunit
MSLSTASRSEVTKQFSTSAWWVLALVLVVYVGSTAAGLGAVLAASAAGKLSGANAPRLPADTVVPVLYSLAASIGYVFPLLIGTLMVTAEFRHKTLTPTFLATPRRGRVLFAKVLVGILLGALYAVFAVISTVGPAAGVLTGFGIDTKLGETSTWALLGRIVLAFIVWALIGIGVGTLVRNQVAAIVIVLAFTQFVEPIARVAASFVKGLSDVTRFFPGAASDTLVGQSIYNSALASPGGTQAASGHPLEWWVGGLVLLGYAVVFLILGYVASWRRDVS